MPAFPLPYQSSVLTGTTSNGMWYSSIHGNIFFHIRTLSKTVQPSSSVSNVALQQHYCFIRPSLLDFRILVASPRSRQPIRNPNMRLDEYEPFTSPRTTRTSFISLQSLVSHWLLLWSSRNHPNDTTILNALAATRLKRKIER